MGRTTKDKLVESRSRGYGQAPRLKEKKSGLRACGGLGIGAGVTAQRGDWWKSEKRETRKMKQMAGKVRGEGGEKGGRNMQAGRGGRKNSDGSEERERKEERGGAQEKCGAYA